jgi:long-subunit fatty acid transport protein
VGLRRLSSSGAGKRLDPRLASAVAVAVASAFAAPVVASNGARLTSISVRAAGRGGVDYAFADDATGPGTNPAGMAFISNRFDQTWIAAFADATFKNQFGSFHMSPQAQIPVPAYSFGIVLDPTAEWHLGAFFDPGNWNLKPSADDPPDDKIQNQVTPTVPPTERAPTVPPEANEAELYGGKIRFGFGVFPVSGGQFTYRHLETPFFSPASLQYQTIATELAVTPSIAYRIVDTPDFSISIGYAPQFHYATFKQEGPIEQPRATLTPPFALSSALLNSNSVQSYSVTHDVSTFGFSQRAGAMFKSQMFAIGLAYQDRTYNQDYLGNATVDSNTQINKLTNNNPGLLQIINPNINPAIGFGASYAFRIQNYQQPREAGVGFAFRPIDRIALGIDYTYIGWAELFRVFQVRLSGGSNPNLNIITGPTLKVRIPLEYTDQHVIAIGGSACILQGDDIVPGEPSYMLILRLGYNYGKNPVPANTSLPQTPIYFEHHATIGLSFQWGPYIDFNIAMEHAFYTGVHTGISQVNSDLDFSHQEVKLTTFFGGIGANF